jgi:hypothetical protein
MRARTVETIPHDAWVIAAGPASHPVYWCGAGWSGNPRHAVLLVRREDAQRVALNLGLLGPDWDVPDDIRAVPTVKPTPAAMVRGLATWRHAA